MQNAEFSLAGKKVWIAGHNGMVGRALARRLEKENCHILKAPREELDLRRQEATEKWVEANKPDVVFLAAAKVGGIYANQTYPADFLYDNLAISANVLHACYLSGVEKLLFLGSSCIYPRLAPQPIKEDQLLSGPLEPTNQWYAIAKISGLMMCQAYRRQYGCDFIAAMPCNLYGPGDNYDERTSHVVAALIRKAHLAKAANASTMEIWGTGTPLREFLFIDDLADALVFLMKDYSSETPINIGSDAEHSISALAHAVASAVGFTGSFTFDSTQSDGTPRKKMDSGRLAALGWHPRTPLEEGLKAAYRWYLENSD